MMKKLFLSALILLPVAAGASTVIGNPNSSVLVANGADVYVHSVKAYGCSGGFQVMAVDHTLDQWESSNLSFQADSYCDVVVRLRWSPGSPLVPVAVSGFDVLSISGAGSAFAIELDESVGKARIP